MNDLRVSVLCLIATLAIYFLNKRLYRRWHKLLMMPLVMTPMVLVALLVITHISWQNYIGESHWLLWLLGPATLAFAVPVYEKPGDHPPPLDVAERRGDHRHLGCRIQLGVAGAHVNAAGSHPAQPGGALDHHAFALAAAKQLGGQPDLVALFVVITGVFGMAVGDVLFIRLAVKQGMAKGAGFGAASHGAGTARAYEIGQEEGVVSSLVMMLSGVVTVIIAPAIGHLLWATV